MSLKVTFKRGAMQSLQAADYFTGAASSLLEGWIDRLEGRLYVMNPDGGGVVQLRIWMEREFTEEQMHHLFVWLMIVSGDIERLRRGELPQDRIPRMLENWLALRHGGASFLVERSVLPAGGAVSEQADLSIGVLGGRTVLVSTDSLMFTRLHEGIYGLSLAGKGSYLVERVDDTGPALRRAS